MPLASAITDLEQLKDRPEVARLIATGANFVAAAKFDRDELSIYVRRDAIREACPVLRDDPELQFNFLSDITCVDWFPSEPRFEVVYHLFSIPTKRRVRLKVQLRARS